MRWKGSGLQSVTVWRLGFTLALAWLILISKPGATCSHLSADQLTAWSCLASIILFIAIYPSGSSDHLPAVSWFIRPQGHPNLVSGLHLSSAPAYELLPRI